MEENQTFIPEGWEKQKGDNLFKVQSGYAFKSNDYKDEGVLLVRISNVGNNNFIYKDLIYVPKRFLTSHSNFLLDKDDVLMGLTGDLGKICILENGEFPFILNQRVGRFIFNENVNNRFLYYLISSSTIQNKFDAFFIGGAQKNISPKQIESVEYIVPKSTTVQQFIAVILSKTDEAIANTEVLINKYTQIKIGLMQDLLTKGIDEKGNIRTEQTHEFKASPLGRIPKEWDVKNLKGICKYDITYGIVQAGPDIENGIPYIRTGDMSGDKLSINGLLRTTPFVASKFGRSRMQFGEIVFALRATIGKVLIVPFELDGANLTQGTARISANEEIIKNDFLLWCLRMPYFNLQILQNQKGTTFFEISLSQLRKMSVYFPTKIEEQERVIVILKKAEKKIADTKLELTKLHSLKTGLMQDLLSGKVRVNDLKANKIV